MGLTEVLRHLPRLLSLRSALLRRLRAARPHIFIGIDAPEFNLRLARALRGAGLRTVQYVSPQVWAWRQGRGGALRAARDPGVCLSPVEGEVFPPPGGAGGVVGGSPAGLNPPSAPTGARRAALST